MTDDKIIRAVAEVLRELGPAGYAVTNEERREVAEAVLAAVEPLIREQALRAAAERWKPWSPGGCPTCETDPLLRQTVGLVCQTCGHDYGADDD